MVLDETLRLYPPAWIGPRRAVREFEFGGYTVPRGAYVNYCSWASHRLPEVFPEPEAFIPERFTRERKAALPRGAYVPFGGGSRICIGKRFGQTEVKLVATMLLQRMRFELLPGRTMTIRQMPTLSPAGGLEMRAREPRDPRARFPDWRLALGQAASDSYRRHRIASAEYGAEPWLRRRRWRSIEISFSHSVAVSRSSPPSQESSPGPPLRKSNPSPPKSWSSPIWP